MAIWKAEDLHDLVVAKLQEAGANAEAAKAVADVTVAAELRGISSHGMQMIPIYMERLQAGGIEKGAYPKVTNEDAIVHLIDGGNGCGQHAAVYAMEKIIAGVKQGKVVICGIYGTNHCGMLAYYTEEIAKNYAVGVMTSNTNPNTAAFGGTQKVLGTNPLSISVPTKEECIVIDMATTAIAKGKIYEYERNKVALPEGYALDAEGKATTDPSKAIKGALLPFGGYKGYALSLLVEIVSGIITNAGYSKQVKSLHTTADEAQNVGLFMMGIPLSSFMEKEVYEDRIEDLKKTICEGVPAEGFDGIFMPGQIEYTKRNQYKEYGVEIDDKIIAKLKGEYVYV